MVTLNCSKVTSLTCLLRSSPRYCGLAVLLIQWRSQSSLFLLVGSVKCSYFDSDYIFLYTFHTWITIRALEGLAFWPGWDYDNKQCIPAGGETPKYFHQVCQFCLSLVMIVIIAEEGFVPLSANCLGVNLRVMLQTVPSSYPAPARTALPQ